MAIRLARSSLASRVDEVFAALALGRSRRSRARSRAESLDHAERMETLGALGALHAGPPFDAPPEVFFGSAGARGSWEEQHVRALPGGRVIDVRWRSAYDPASSDPEVRRRYLAPAPNEWAAARLWLHDRPRPAAILIHGYLGGSYRVEERAWPVRWMFERLGLDLAIPVLPFHGPRGVRGKRPLFPSSDPRLNVEGFRQAMWDLISLRRALMERGAEAVGAMGMSLGGYTTALAMTADRELAFGVPMIPLASIADFARDAGRLVGSEDEQRAQHAALEQAHRPVSPFARPACVDRARLLILAGEADRITPASHAERLAAHFGARVRVFPGGHLLQFGRAEGFREVARMLRGLELLQPR